MSASDAVLAGGIGYVVPVGGLEMTGVLLVEVVVSLLLHETINNRQHRTVAVSTGRNILVFFVLVMLDSRGLNLFMRHRLTGNAILTFNPPAQIDKLTPLRAEGTKRIIFPLDWFTAGWALHL